MAIRIKPGVNITGICPELVLALLIADGIWLAEGTDLVITCGADGKHRKNSLHYVTRAVDLRRRNLPAGRAAPVARSLRTALGKDYDVVVERSHIHVEFQPKTGINLSD